MGELSVCMSTTVQDKEGCYSILSSKLIIWLAALVLTEYEDHYYQGYYHEELPDGKGIIVYKNGDCYYGNTWLSNLFLQAVAQVKSTPVR